MSGEQDPTGRVVVFGEVLFDRFPDGAEVLGGAPFNVAWNLRGLGANPLLVSRVGDDELGARILAAMQEWGLDTGAVQVDPRRPTGTVEVTLDGGEPAFDIVEGRAYDAVDAAAIPPLPGIAILYHGSLACRAQRSRAALESLIRRLPRCVFLDVNLRPPWWTDALLRDLLGAATEIKLNEHELNRLAPGDGSSSSRGQALLSRCGAERLYVTRGARGATAIAARGVPVEVDSGHEVRVTDTVGAGDAFSTVLLLGRLEGWPLDVTMRRARDFAAAVVGLRGATTRERSFYETFATAWRST